MLTTPRPPPAVAACAGLCGRTGEATHACARALRPQVRDRRAGYAESLGVLEHAKRVNPNVVTKTSVMLGLGEEAAEVRQLMR